MAFNANYLKVLGDQTTASYMPVIWVYYNPDGDTVTTAGYIPVGYNVKAGDRVIVIPKSGAVAWYSAAVADNVITLSADA